MRKSSKKKPTANGKGKRKQNPISSEGKILVLVKENPKRANAAKRFSFYKTGMLVSTYEKKVGPAQARADLRWDRKQNFIKIT